MLLSPLPLNHSLTLKNRIVMAPMTRSMCDDNLVPTQLMLEYYARRAAAGLIVSEGIIIRPDGQGYPNVPGLFNQQQMTAWRRITDAVHANGGLIFAQIWHAGRVSHPIYLQGALPVSPSATTMSGPVKRGNGLRYGKARELTKGEIRELVTSFATAAANARAAGFDGIEFHGANGYLIDQFLHYDTNHRQDEYGGTAERMTRFVLEMTRACADAIGPERIAMRLSPAAYLHEIRQDIKDKDVFKYLFEELNKMGLAYLHTGAFDDAVTYPELEGLSMTGFMRKYYTGHLVASGSYTAATAEQALMTGQADAIAFGRAFISNPDLVERIAAQREWVAYDNSMLDSLY